MSLVPPFFLLFQENDLDGPARTVRELHSEGFTKGAIIGWIGPESSREIAGPFNRFLREMMPPLETTDTKKGIDVKYTVSVLLSNRVQNDLENNDYWLSEVGFKVRYTRIGSISNMQFFLIIPSEFEGISALKHHQRLCNQYGLAISHAGFVGNNAIEP